MKTKSFILFAFTGLTTFSSPAWSAGPRGGESSGGGISVVCRDLRGQLTQAAPLELYEAVTSGSRLKPASSNLERDYISLLMELRKASADTRTPTPKDLNFLKHMLSRFQFVKHALPPTLDGGRLPEKLPNGCRIEQAIIADDVSGRFFVNEEIWKSLNSMEQAAFVIHEHLYQVARLDGAEKTSARVREIVAAAATVGGLENSYGGATQGQSMICTASLSQREALTSEGSANSRVVIYDNPKNPHESVLLLAQYFGFRPLFRMAYRFPKFDAAKLVPTQLNNEKVLVVNDPKLKTPPILYIGQRNLRDEKIGVNFTHGQPFTLSQLNERNEVVRTALFKECHVWKWAL